MIMLTTSLYTRGGRPPYLFFPPTHLLSFTHLLEVWCPVLSPSSPMAVLASGSRSARVIQMPRIGPFLHLFSGIDWFWERHVLVGMG